MYEGGIRVPCFVQWPAHWQGNREIDRIAAHIDLLPTLLEIARVEPPADLDLDGESLVPLLEGAAREWPDRRLFFQCHRGLTPRRYQNCAVVTQRWKLIGHPGTFSQEDSAIPEEPVFELYDLQHDPSESDDVAGTHPELVRKLTTAYDRWFEDVRSSRGFQPGVIHLGSEAENPAVLCRYQDATYRDGQPHGWSVRILESGRYELTVKRGPLSGPGRICVDWQDETRSRRIEADESSAVFDLAAGQGVLDVWFQQEGEDRAIFTDNGTAGDVTVR